jgi:signal peptidase I
MSVNYAQVLFYLMVATGVVWLVDRAVFRRARIAGARAALHRFDLQAGLEGTDAARVDADTARIEREHLRERLLRAPGWIELPAGFFPVLLAVFLLRSFVFEPFRIPSGSMIPTLEVGDFILVNKFAYGLRLPIVDRKIVSIGSPQRGDVVVFRYPLDPSEDYVKRLIGLPGDTIVYRNKQLTVNGKLVATTSAPDYFDPDRVAYSKQLSETLPRGDAAVVHHILIDERREDAGGPMVRFPFIDQCRYTDGNTTVTCTVPQGHYFMMGDNRDNSADSRSWGFVPDANLVGKAVLIWMNFGNLKRIGGFD